MLAWEHSEVVEIHRRRYMLKNDALEIFLITGKTLLLSFESTEVIIMPLQVEPSNYPPNEDVSDTILESGHLLPQYNVWICTIDQYLHVHVYSCGCKLQNVGNCFWSRLVILSMAVCYNWTCPAWQTVESQRVKSSKQLHTGIYMYVHVCTCTRPSFSQAVPPPISSTPLFSAQLATRRDHQF